jgi:hypothetical protein
MGHGHWSTDVYAAAARYRRSTGKSAFGYSDMTLGSLPHEAWKPHVTLDPLGVTVRESRDSGEHPTSVAIAVLFDVTGSMHVVPRVLQTKLPRLHGLLQDGGYARDPQILFGAIGDATCDRVPLQVGQFESDNRMDEHLGNILLEGGGGGQMTESYELAMYFMARHTSIDCHERRGHKGYLFIIGDEMPYPSVKASEVRRVIGDDLRESIPTSRIVAELRQAYEVFYILPAGTAYYGDDRVLSSWRRLLGQNVLLLDDLNAVCETIAVTVGLGEAAIELDQGIDQLREFDGGVAGSVGKALANAGGGRGAAGTGPASPHGDAASPPAPGADPKPPGVVWL